MTSTEKTDPKMFSRKKFEVICTIMTLEGNRSTILEVAKKVIFLCWPGYDSRLKRSLLLNWRLVQFLLLLNFKGTTSREEQKTISVA